MNKRDLIDAISGRLGDKKTATEAVNAVLDTIQHTVAKGDKVAITGFGVFEKSDRPARTARNPATGASIKVPKSSVQKESRTTMPAVQRRPVPRASAVCSSLSIRTGNVTPVASHIFWKYDVGDIPGNVLISLTTICASGV